MPVQPHRPARLAFHVFRGSEAVRRGVLTEHQLRSHAWLRLRHDVYGDARLDRDHTLACRGALARLPPGTVLAGPSAAYLHGVGHAAGFGDDVHVVTPAGERAGTQQRLRVHHVDLDPADVHEGDGLPRTTAARTAWDVGAWLKPVVAVPIIDALLARGLVPEPALMKLATRLEGRPGSRRAQAALALADAAAELPLESRLRVRLVLGGLPRPAVRQSLVLESGRVLRPHLCWPEHRVAVEIEGVRPADDQRRVGSLAAAGWIVLHVVPGRVRTHFPEVLAEVRAALAQAGWRR